ncbi:CpsD/CapB family tyrosine-protein kinase [uncultured Clostridium sp.]|jgi:capsular exopolysaccharide synthesis family protein|uniref:CpsD/CapB family tyrosine-protein kinase n=1 Tax=Clostridium sp. TaxID=1506 RepID=UPI0025D80560|nr:CpsD/CapB family tyrosine-protein kinase [uncultured Clostridium sp.]
MFITSKMPKSISAEAYRSLRTSIKFSSVDKPIKTIVVTSSIPGEGKSTISGNLAITLSQSGARVLLIDCDLRKPSIHKKFRVVNDLGLTDILVDKCSLKDVIKKIDEYLFMITAGTIPPNPSEIVGSNSMEDLIKELSLSFDYIVMDTPPVIPVTDPLLLAAKSDATIIVVRARKTKEKIIRQAYDELIKVNSNIIGSILNDSETKTNNSYYEYYAEEDKWSRHKRRISKKLKK